MKWWNWSASTTDRVKEANFCRVHGNLSSNGQYGGILMRDYMSEPICPFCFGEWLVKNFPVERKEIKP